MQKCQFCNLKGLRRYRRIDGYDLMLCKKCGLISTLVTDKNNRNKYIKKQYSNNYSIGYSNNLLKMQRRYHKYLTLIKKYLLKGKLLDVGCGTGYFLKYISGVDNSWKLFGVEPNDALRKVAKMNSGLQIKKGNLGNLPFKNNYFDVVTCNDVLEHSIELTKNLKELHRVLKPNGVLLIQSPNYISYMARLTGKNWDWWAVPDHVLHFSYKFLSMALPRNGFVILNSYTYEDQEDFLANIKGVFRQNILTKISFILLIPFLILIERLGWATGKGGLSLLLTRKI